MLLLNDQLAALSESFSIALADKVRQMKANGTAVIGLQTGDPDFDTPQPIIDAAQKALRDGQTHYTDSRGLPGLRQAIARKIAEQQGVDYDPQSEILVTHGAIHAYYTGLQAIIKPGDTVLVPDPSWQTHANMVRVLRGQAVRVPSLPENNFFPTFEAWEESLTPQTVALVINTPNNPTGCMASQAYLQMLVEFAERHNLYIISDEVYERLVYDDNRHISVASIPGAQERTLLVNSLSKTYAMTGWRVGYLAAPKQVIDQALKASQHSITNLAPFIQVGAMTALSSAEVETQVQTMVAAYARRRQQVLDIYADYPEAPVGVVAPQGAFYFFMDVRRLNQPSAVLANRLLDEARVALVPGAAYGQAGEGFLRMTIAASDDEVEQGFLTFLQWVGQLR